MHTPSKDALRCHTDNGGRGLHEAGPCRANTSEKQQRAENPACDGCERLEIWGETHETGRISDHHMAGV